MIGGCQKIISFLQINFACWKCLCLSTCLFFVFTLEYWLQWRQQNRPKIQGNLPGKSDSFDVSLLFWSRLGKFQAHFTILEFRGWRLRVWLMWHRVASNPTKSYWRSTEDAERISTCVDAIAGVARVHEKTKSLLLQTTKVKRSAFETRPMVRPRIVHVWDPSLNHGEKIRRLKPALRENRRIWGWCSLPVLSKRGTEDAVHRANGNFCNLLQTCSFLSRSGYIPQQFLFWHRLFAEIMISLGAQSRDSQTCLFLCMIHRQMRTHRTSRSVP